MYNYGMYNNGYVPYSQNAQPSYNAPNQAYNGFSAVPNGFNAQPNFNGFNGNQYSQNQSQPNNPNAAQTNTNKIYVTGIEDARNRALAPNSDFIFLDNDKPLLYRKTVDGTGKMEIHTFKIMEYDENEEKPAPAPVAPQIDTSQFVSIREFNSLRNDLDDDFKAVQDDIGRIKSAVNKLNQQLSQQPSASKSEPREEHRKDSLSNGI